MENIYYVYELRRADRDEPFYIGKGKEKRYTAHFRKNQGNNEHKYNTIQKANIENVPIIINLLWENLSEKDALQREVWAIKLWGRNDLKEGPLTNKTDGGEGIAGHKQSEEHKNKISEKNKGKPKSEAHKKALSAAKLGRKQSEERIADRVRKSKITNQTAETKEKRSKASKNRVWDEDQKIKASESAKNRLKFTCEYCGKICQVSGYKTYHGERCKFKPTH